MSEDRARIGRLLKLLKRYRSEHTAAAVGEEIDEGGRCACPLCTETVLELSKGGLHPPRRHRRPIRAFASVASARRAP